MKHSETIPNLLGVSFYDYLKVFLRRKNTFITVFLLIIVIGGIRTYLFVPSQLYRATIMIQPPVIGESLTGANDLISAENLRSLIKNNVFSYQLRDKNWPDLNPDALDFSVEIPEKTNILRVSLDLDSTSKDRGAVILKKLCEVISRHFAKRIEAKLTDLDNQIKQNERNIINTRERQKNLRVQIDEITNREDKLREELKAISKNTEQILNKREELFVGNSSTESASTLLLANYLQNNSSYLNQVNNQFSALSLRRGDLDLEIKTIDSQISDFQMAIEKLNLNKSFISNLKIIGEPKIYLTSPLISNNKKMALYMMIGLLFAILAVISHEFWIRKLDRHE